LSGRAAGLAGADAAFAAGLDLAVAGMARMWAAAAA
jgi:hypothetical protein